jgi:hypothetical protein
VVAPQHPGRLDDVTLRERLADGGRRPRVRRARDAQGVDVEAVLAAELVEGRGAAGRLGAEAEVLADHDGARRQRVDEHPLDELLGRPRGQIPVEAQDQHGVDTCLEQQVTTLVDRGEPPRRPLRQQHLHGVRVEGDGDHRQPAECVGSGAGAADHHPVSAVDAVEVADGDHRATEIGRDLVEGVPDAHGRQPARRSADEDGHGGGVGAALLVQRQEEAVGVEQRDRLPGGSVKPGRLRPWRTSRAVSSSRSTAGNARRAAAGSGTGRYACSSCSSVRASSSVNSPTRVRRSAVRCPPTPSAAPRSRAIARTYVPAEQVRLTSTSTYGAATRTAPTSSRCTRTDLAASSTSSPARTARTRAARRP